jgi:PIN domain nuclease of toxin-antitoxin system
MKTDLLLDTCAVVWVSERAKMRAEAVAAIDEAADAEKPIFVSLITAWEFGLLESRGRMPMTRSARSAFASFVRLPGIRTQELTADVLIDSSFLPGAPPNDPADRLIIATARAHDLTIVTRDDAILAYAGEGHVRALAC